MRDDSIIWVLLIMVVITALLGDMVAAVVQWEDTHSRLPLLIDVVFGHDNQRKLALSSVFALLIIGNHIGERR
jgi:hypothetical protein